ncbi:hypothetical protein AB0469_31940 [Streptomyces sp. NPDC093801]|uniref:phage tail protein n=1 Tax=Streptomyces sp. NPDC093801 TaxID=3155203 RepID=UPI00344BBB30
MALTIGELVARIDADDAGFARGLSRAELEMRGFQRSTDGRLRALNGRFQSVGNLREAELRVHGFVEAADGSLRTLDGRLADLSHPVRLSIGGDSSGVRRAVRDAQTSVAGYTTDASGRLRGLDGRFIAAGERAALGLSTGDREGRRFSLTLGHLGSVAGAVGSAVASKGALMGVGIASALPAAAGLVAALQNILPAAGLGATAVFALGQAFGAVKLGTSGIAEALGAAGKAAATAASGAKAAASAQQSLSDAVKSAARANEQAAKQVATAERGLAEAQREARAAQMALNDAREQGARDLEDLNNRLVDAELSQRDAVLDVADAQEALAKARASGDPKEIARAELAYDRAVQRLKEQTTETARLRQETAKANADGVEGTNAVRQAQERIADTQRTVADRERDLADARQEAARTAADGIEQVRRAQAALAEATGGQADPFAEAMGKLAPAAKAFVQALLDLKPAWEGLRLDVQQTLMQGLAGEMTRTASSVLPVLRRELVDSAGALNLMGRGVLDAARNLADSGTLGRAMASASAGLRNLSRAPGQIVTGLGQVAAAAGPAFERLTAAAGGALDRLAAKMADSFASGRMQKAIEQAITLVGQLFDVIGNVGSMLGSLFGAAQASGGGFLGVLQQVTKAMADAFDTPAVQAGLKSIYETMSVLGQTVGPLLADALQAIAPVFTALGPPIQIVIRALGAGLQPVIKALGPVLVAAARAFGSLITAAAPLLTTVGTLVAALLPAVTPLFDALVVVFDALAPVVRQVADTLVAALQPVLAALPGIIGPLAKMLGDQLALWLGVIGDILVQLSPSLVTLGQSLGQLMVALSPLIAMWAQMSTELLQHLLPALQPVLDLFVKIAAYLISDFARSIRDVAVPLLQSLGALMRGDLSGAADYAKQALRGLVRDAVLRFTELPQLVRDAFGNIGSVLYNAGASAMIGFINGLRAMIPSLRDHLGWITSMIPSWKGPETLDARLLTPAGRSVIEGFQRGISLATPGLEDQLSGLTGSLPGMTLAPVGGMAAAGGTAGGSAPRITVELAGPQEMKQLIRRIVANDGGNVQTVLGQPV